MEDLLFKIWLGLGILCVIAEFLLPGLVVIFVGLGALTTAFAQHLGYTPDLPSQLLTFFVSSLIYLFTLRLLVLRFVPSDSTKANINEDDHVIGDTATVVTTIPVDGVGRISHGGTSWQAKSKNNEEIQKDLEVKIVKRENITWIVEKI